MEEENLTDESTDVWHDNIVQKFERRPMESMANVTLADFATAYAPKPNDEYKKRDVPPILHCRYCYMGDIVDYMDHCRQLCVEMDSEDEAQLKRKPYLNRQKEDTNNDDINVTSDGMASIVKTNKIVQRCVL
jgi:hypothetical protein